MIARIAHSGRLGEVAQRVAEDQLELAQTRVRLYLAIETRYSIDELFRKRIDRLAPALARSIRNGRLFAALLERLSAWKPAAGQ